MISKLPDGLKGEALQNSLVLHQYMHDAHGQWMFSPRMAEECIDKLYAFILRKGRKGAK